MMAGRLMCFFALEMLNVGAYHEILDDPRAPGTRNKQKIIDQISWLKQIGITETIVPLPPRHRGQRSLSRPAALGSGRDHAGSDGLTR